MKPPLITLPCALLLLNATCVLPQADAPATAPATAAVAERIAQNIGLLNEATMVLRYPPFPVYQHWRHQVEQCSGKTRDGWPSFWLAQHSPMNAEGAIGLYLRPHRRIAVAIGHELVDYVIRHELLHDLLDIPGDREQHPPDVFFGRCRHLVYPAAGRP